MMRIVYRWLPAVTWMTVIFWLSHQPGSELNGYLPWIQSWMPWVNSFDFGHFIAYFILAFLLWWAIGSTRTSVLLLVVFLCFIYGVTDEYHQSFVDGRSPDLADLRNDTIGAVLAMLPVTIPKIRNRLLRKADSRKY